MKRVLLFLFISSLYSIVGEEYVISTGPVSNIYIDFFRNLITDVYESIGMDVKIEHTSMEKSLALVNRGYKDAELFRAAIVEDKYPNLVRVDEPLFNIETTAFYYKKDLVVNSWDSLRGCRVTYVRGVKTYEAGLEGVLKVTPSDTLDIAFKLLKNGRVDVVISGKLNGLQMAKRKDMLEDLLFSDPISLVPVYHFLHRDNIELADRLAEQFKVLDIDYYMEQFLK